MKAKTNAKLSVRDICYIGVFAAIIGVCAQIRIPTVVPFTMQTFAIAFAGIVLGAKNGALATIVYVLLGGFGAPVFAGFTSGVRIITGPTGGFILSFPAIALAAGFCAAKGGKLWLGLGLAVGTAVNYLCGMIWFGFIMSTDLYTAFTLSVSPFLLPDAVKMVLAAGLGTYVKLALVKNRLLY